MRILGLRKWHAGKGEREFIQKEGKRELNSWFKRVKSES